MYATIRIAVLISLRHPKEFTSNFFRSPKAHLAQKNYVKLSEGLHFVGVAPVWP